jgi:hypothetical integral membrane protein (TIGR02206 family)
MRIFDRIAVTGKGPLAVDFLLSPNHVAALASTGALCVGLTTVARLYPGPWLRPLSRGLAVLVIGWFAAYHVVVLLEGSYSLSSDLPLHLSDVVVVVAAAALWTWRPLVFELTFFWGLTASLQAILTPSLDPDEGPSSFFYWHYFITHSVVVLAAIFLAFGLGLSARPDVVRRMFLATAAWAVVASIGNVITDGNYMFLREPPETRSLLDYLGPWPWYIVGAAMLALVLYFLLDLPFRRRRALRADSTFVASRPP